MEPHFSPFDRKSQQNIKILVDRIDQFDPRTRALFELSLLCEMPRHTPRPLTQSDAAAAAAIARDNPYCDQPAHARSLRGSSPGARDNPSGDEGRIAPHSARPRTMFTPLGPPPVPMKGRQTYRMWKAACGLSSLFSKPRFSETNKILRFLPLEEYKTSGFSMPGFESITEFLVAFMQAFFPGLDVVLERCFDISRIKPVSRFHSRTKKKQFLVTDIYRRLHEAAHYNKKDYILGLTWTDLYPSENLNFALGEALFSHRCAVFSFGRYEPQSYKCEHPGDCEKNGDEENRETQEKLGTSNTSEIGEDETFEITAEQLWKMMRVSSHEVCHLFGLSHCVFFECAMNESSSVAQALAQPLQLCPVCLRKLQKFLGFDVTTRYQDLLAFCEKLGHTYPTERLTETLDGYRRIVDFMLY